MPNSDPNFFFGEIPTVDQWNGDFADKVDGLGGTLDSGFVIGSTIDATSVVDVLVPGSTTARALTERFKEVFHAEDFGAVGDRQQYSGTLTCLAGANPILTIAGADLSAVSPGQLVVMPFGGLGGGVTAPATIAAAAWLAPNKVTVTTASPHNIPLGQTIQATIAGCTPDAYNGTFAITPTSVSTFTYVLVTDPTALTVPGTWVPVTIGAKATVGMVAGSQIVLNGTVSTAFANIAFQAIGTPTIGASGTGVSPLDVYTLVGGTFVVPAKVIVQTTKVISVAINVAGSGGVDGVYTFRGTSPGATKFQFTGTITGGVLASVVATPILHGIYQKNPPAIDAEPIVDVNSVSGLVGATVAIVMGANTSRIQGQASSIASVVVSGGYSVVPPNPVATTGPATGVTFNVQWTAPTVVIGTDNAPFINAASNEIRAEGIQGHPRTQIDGTLVFPSGGDFLVNDSLNITAFSHFTVDGNNARIYSCAVGLPVFDQMDSQNVNTVNFTITGDPTFPPRWSFQYGTASATTAANMGFDKIILEGTFADAGFDYNFGSEVINIGSVRGNLVAPYSRIEDSCNTTFWNVASKYVATTIPRDTAQTFGGGRGGAIALTNNHPLGCSVWMLGGSGHNYNDSYLFAHQEAFLIIASGLDATDGLLADSCHIEGARHGVFVQNFGAPHGNLVPAFNRFLFRNAQASFTESLFGMSDDIVELTILNNNISVSFQASTSNYFSDPSRVSFSGLVLGGDGAIGRWADNVPADMTGVVILTGPSAPELFVYNMKAQTDTVIDGELSVNGLVQVGTAVNVSDGTVASVTVTAQGIYSNPDFPSVTIDDPPAGGTTALATVTGMVWFGDNTVIAGGSGYSVGQFFTLVGGTFTTAATGFITAVDGSGVVLSFRGATSGVYSVYPPLGATHTTSGGGGTGLIINAKAWGVHLDTTGVTVTLAGAGYTTFPGVTFSTPLSGHTAARGKVIMGTAIENNAKGINSHALQISTTYANDTAAEAGGVALGEFYRNGSVLQIRVT